MARWSPSVRHLLPIVCRLALMDAVVTLSARFPSQPSGHSPLAAAAAAAAVADAGSSRGASSGVAALSADI